MWAGQSHHRPWENSEKARSVPGALPVALNLVLSLESAWVWSTTASLRFLEILVFGGP